MGMFGWLKSFFQESESVPQEKVVKMPEEKKLQKQEMARIFEEKYPMYVMDVEDLQELPMITFASGLRVNLADRSIAQKIANIPEGASVRICQKDDGGLDVGYFPESYARVMDPRSLDIDMGVQANGSRYYQLRTYGGIRIDSPEAVEVRDNYVEELSRKRALRAQRKEGTEALKNVEERTPKVEFVHNETRNLDEANLPKIRMGNTELDLQSFADVFSKLPVGGEIVIGRRDLKESPEKDNVEFGLSQDGKMKIMLRGWILRFRASIWLSVVMKKGSW